MKELINKKCRVFVKNLSEKPIVYRGFVEAVDEIGTNVILTILDMNKSRIRINVSDIVQIIQDEGDY